MSKTPTKYSKKDSLNSSVTELRNQHPIKDWMEYISSELLFDEINFAHLMMNNKEISELFDDFKDSKNIKLKNHVINVKNLSDEIVENYVEAEFKERYLASHYSSTKNFNTHEMQNIRFLKDID